MIVNELALAIFAQLYVYVILGFLVVLLILLIIRVIEQQVKKKNALLMKEKLIPETASKFGKAISVSADALRFERNETIFDAKIKSEEVILPDAGNITSTELEVRFNLPNLQEKFFIQHKSIFSTYSADYEPILISAMPDNLIFQSLNSQFLLTLLEQKKVFAKIEKYQSSWMNQFKIAF